MILTRFYFILTFLFALIHFLTTCFLDYLRVFLGKNFVGYPKKLSVRVCPPVENGLPYWALYLEQEKVVNGISYSTNFRNTEIYYSSFLISSFPFFAGSDIGFATHHSRLVPMGWTVIIVSLGVIVGASHVEGQSRF